MRKILGIIIATACLVGATAAYGQAGQYPANQFLGGPASGGAALPKPRAIVGADLPSGFANAPSVANLTALQAACTASSGCPGGDPIFTGGVWRLTYGNGNGAEPLWYTPQNSACSISAGNGDNGLQVKSADGKCWIAQFPAGGASILQYGALGDGATDNTTSIQNAINNLPGNGFRIVIPDGATGNFCVFSGLTIPASPTQGYAPTIIGYSAQSSNLDTCNHDVTLITWKGNYGYMANIGLYCRGSHTTDLMTITKPCFNQNGGGNNRFSNLTILGGTNTMLLNGNANGTLFDNIFVYNAYGGANVLIQNASWITFLRGQFDQSWPSSAITSAAATFNAWASAQAYAANTVVSTNGYYIQCMNCNGVRTSGSVAPTLAPYGASITDNQLTWQLLAPATYYGVQCDTGCAASGLVNSDLAGPYTDNFRMSNSLSGTAPSQFFIEDTTFSLGIGQAIQGDAGGDLTVKGGSISGCALSGCAAVELANSWSGPAIVSGVHMIGTLGYAAINTAGTKFNFSNNVVTATILSNGYLAQSSVTQFTVADNIFPNLSGAITIANAAEDYYSIVGNVLNGGTVSDNGTGTHKIIFNPGAPLAIGFGGTNCATASGTCLDNITGLSSTGLLARTGAGAYTARTLQNGAGISISNPDGVAGNPSIAVSLSSLTNSLGADVNLNNTASYFDGPSVAQGSTGTWFASGSTAVDDTAGAASLTCKLWDGTTIINAGAVNSNGASGVATIALSGQITNPAGNIRISCNDSTSVNGKILHGVAGSNSAVVTVIRLN